MKGGLAILALVAVLVLAIGGWVVSNYNGLVTKKTEVEKSFAEVDNLLLRRNDLIPNLVETVKAYMTHERETLDAVIQARNGAVTASKKAASNPGNPEAMTDLNQAESQLTAGLGRLLPWPKPTPT